MSGSYILKDRAGKPAGYLFKGFGGLRCGFSGAEDGMVMVLFYADGSHVTRPLDTTGAEQEWEDGGNSLIGAAIVKGDALVADTGREAEEAWERLLKGRQKKKEKARSEEAEEQRKTEREPMEKNPAGYSALPQPRWPRPPCWKKAAYREGRWNEE